MIIRRAEQRDVSALGRLGAMLVRAHYDFDNLRFIPATPQTEQGYGSFLGRQLSNADYIIFVAELDGEVVGYAWSGVEGFDYMALRGPAGALYDIIVDPAHRAHHIGRRLLDATIAELETRKVPRIVLSTAVQNVPAQHLFASAGFRQTMIEMTRELGGSAGGSSPA